MRKSKLSQLRSKDKRLQDLTQPVPTADYRCTCPRSKTTTTTTATTVVQIVLGRRFVPLYDYRRLHHHHHPQNTSSLVLRDWHIILIIIIITIISIFCGSAKIHQQQQQLYTYLNLGTLQVTFSLSTNTFTDPIYYHHHSKVW